MKEGVSKYIYGYWLRIFVLALMICIIILAWLTDLDDFAEPLLNDAILEAGIIFGLVRGLNGLISILQDADINVMLVSVSPFELLDPMNDLIERFSELITIALVSLGVQKLILLIVKNHIFNILLTISAFGVAFSSAYFKSAFLFWVRSFAFLLILRFSMILIVLMSVLVNAVFLRELTNSGEQALTDMHSELTRVSATILADKDGERVVRDPASPVINELREEIDDLKEGKQEIIDFMLELNNGINQLNIEIRKIRDEQSIANRWNPFSSTDNRIKDYRTEIDRLDRQSDESAAELVVYDEKIADLVERLACELKRLEGGTCSISEWANKHIGVASFKAKASAALSVLEDRVAAILEAMALVLLKSILMPLAFWFLLYRSLKWTCGEAFGRLVKRVNGSSNPQNSIL